MENILVLYEDYNEYHENRSEIADVIKNTIGIINPLNISPSYTSFEGTVILYPKNNAFYLKKQSPSFLASVTNYIYDKNNIKLLYRTKADGKLKLYNFDKDELIGVRFDHPEEYYKTSSLEDLLSDGNKLMEKLKNL